ncbi:MAG: RNA polymerase sigma factor [Spirochaetales bacterium]|nr:RNA polymerase sigma factor [Spirochaetales bacterium]
MNVEKQGPYPFREVYELAFPILMRVSFRITGDREVAEELCQEAFIRFLNRYPPIPTLDQSKYWLIRVVKNLSLNFVKRKGRERKAFEKFGREPMKVQESVEDCLLRKESAARLREGLEQLPEKLKVVLILKEYSGLNYREIGKVLKISEGNVKVRVFRARNRLQELLDEEGEYVP